MNSRYDLGETRAYAASGEKKMSDTLKLDPAVRSITILKKNDDGGFTPAAVYKNKGGKKRSSKGLRGIEKLFRRIGRAQAAGAGVYNMRHDRSNRKKKDGWMRDLLPNMMKAQRRAIKTLRRRNKN
jgi:Family of unknown function (DUF6312)